MKNKQRIILGAALIAVATLISSNVWAEDGGQTNSDAFLRYEKNLSVVEPVDPIDPPNVIDPGEEKPGTEGPLSIDYASDWNFSSHESSDKSEHYYAMKDNVRLVDGEEKEVPNFFQVTDNSGKNAGWTLYIQQNGQFKTENSSLKGAQIVLQTPEIFTIGDGEEPATKGTIQLDPSGQLSPLLVASENEGTGTWIGMFGNEETADTAIQLKVPGKAAKEEGKYTTSFTWTLATGEI
ncbi:MULTISPECIES: WxL domain-containing protein [unclassified Enterococcus]|uniref:WxL domain-containing protein n=1 Tax=unclassified Enterococcus TaxID=2608891 RepID=UPI001CE1937B|nr:MULTISPECIES: WxL domain-containing protein [unclassified Enterococcus]MCA5012090.1 WxL domain-containing protein [Enterococcus sp. S23]MCA5015341.1 WxL domain-containing protein [Enterococcus sp. S22(2020)]